MSSYVIRCPKSKFRKPTSVMIVCLRQDIGGKGAWATLWTVQPGDRILIVTYADQDEYCGMRRFSAKRGGAEAVDFLYTHELTGVEQMPATVRSLA